MANFRPKSSQIFFLGLVPKSPIHIGLIYVINPKPIISCLGPFNYTKKKQFCWCLLGLDHQKADWSQHKATCSRPFKVEVNPVAGRVMVATRYVWDHSLGRVLLKEKKPHCHLVLNCSSPPLIRQLMQP
jgi:hypothetical protein